MRAMCRRLWRGQDGATALEYGLIGALVVVGLIVSLNLFSTQTINMYNVITTTWQNAVR